jgi:hypothetical protein
LIAIYLSSATIEKKCGLFDLNTSSQNQNRKMTEFMKKILSSTVLYNLGVTMEGYGFFQRITKFAKPSGVRC